MDRYPHEFGWSASASRDCRCDDSAPKLVVLDEPTSALDMTVQVQIGELRDLQQKYQLAFMSRDLKVVRTVA
jgi:microcin C transport system ATP-binding protein